jgi:hypothetical protein
VFWVISVYFNIRNTLTKSGTFLLGHPVYIYIYIYIYGQQRDEVTGEWRKLHNEKLNNLYCSPDTARVMREWDGWACRAYGERYIKGFGGET